MVLVEKPLSELFWDIFGKISTETTIKLCKNNNEILQKQQQNPTHPNLMNYANEKFAENHVLWCKTNLNWIKN